MDWAKLAPWNWFKNEELESKTLPVNVDTTRSDTPSPLMQLQRNFDMLFDQLHRGWGLPALRTPLFENSFFKPLLDVGTDAKRYAIDVELPGIDADDISIELIGRTLVIKGEKHQEHREDQHGYYRMERSYGMFQRTLDLPDDADIDAIASTYRNGVLNVEIPRKVVMRNDTKKIPVKRL